MSYVGESGNLSLQFPLSLTCGRLHVEESLQLNLMRSIFATHAILCMSQKVPLRDVDEQQQHVVESLNLNLVRSLCDAHNVTPRKVPFRDVEEQDVEESLKLNLMRSLFATFGKVTSGKSMYLSPTLFLASQLFRFIVV